MDSYCRNCNERCVSKPICVNCLALAKCGIFKLDLNDGKQKITIHEEQFECRQMINNNNPAESKIYYYVAKAGSDDQHTILVIPHNSYDVDKIWINADLNTAINRSMSEDIGG